MPFSVTYVEDVQAFSLKCEELYNAGKWHQYIDLVNGKPIAKVLKIRTAYATDGSARSVSFCQFPVRDIIGDVNNPDYVPFFAEVGMISLAYGENRGVDCPWKQIETGIGETLHPQARALYEYVMPPTDILDSEGNPTEQKRFNPLGEFAIGRRK